MLGLYRYTPKNNIQYIAPETQGLEDEFPFGERSSACDIFKMDGRLERHSFPTCRRSLLTFVKTYKQQPRQIKWQCMWCICLDFPPKLPKCKHIDKLYIYIYIQCLGKRYVLCASRSEAQQRGKQRRSYQFLVRQETEGISEKSCKVGGY